MRVVVKGVKEENEWVLYRVGRSAWLYGISR